MSRIRDLDSSLLLDSRLYNLEKQLSIFIFHLNSQGFSIQEASNKNRYFLNVGNIQQFYDAGLRSILESVSAIHQLKTQLDPLPIFKVPYSVNAEKFAQAFDDFMSHATIYFLKTPFTPVTISHCFSFFIALHSFYFKMIINPTVVPKIEDFINIWKQFYKYFNEFRGIILQIDFESYTNRFDDYLTGVATVIPDQSVIEKLNQKLNELKADLMRVRTNDSIKDSLNAAADMVNAISSDLHPHRKILDLQRQNDLIQQLNMVVKSAISTLDAMEEAQKINSFVIQKNFSLDPYQFKNVNIMNLINQIPELILYEFRLILDNNYQTENKFAKIKSIAKQYTEVNRKGIEDQEILKELIKATEEYQVTRNAATEDKILEGLNKIINSQLTIQDHITSTRKFLKEYNKYTETLIKTQDQCIASFYRYVYFLNAQAHISVENKDYINGEFAAMCQRHNITLQCQLFGNHIREMGQVIKSALAMQSNVIDPQTSFLIQLKDYFLSLKSILKTWETLFPKRETKGFFMDWFSLFLEICYSNTEVSLKRPFAEAVFPIISILPDPACIASALMIDEIAMKINEKLNEIAQIISTSEQQLRPSNSMQMLWHSEILMKKISDIANTLEDVNLRIKFKLIYYNLYSIVSMTETSKTHIVKPPEKPLEIRDSMINLVGKVVQFMKKKLIAEVHYERLLTYFVNFYKYLFLDDIDNFRKQSLGIVNIIPLIDYSDHLLKAVQTLCYMKRIILNYLHSSLRTDASLTQAFNDLESAVYQVVVLAKFIDINSYAERLFKIAEDHSFTLADMLRTKWMIVSYYITIADTVSKMIESVHKLTVTKDGRPVIHFATAVNFYFALSKFLMSVPELQTDRVNEFDNLIHIVMNQELLMFQSIDQSFIESLKDGYALAKNSIETNVLEVTRQRLIPAIAVLFSTISTTNCTPPVNCSEIIDRIIKASNQIATTTEINAIITNATAVSDLSFAMMQRMHPIEEVSAAYEELQSSLKLLFNMVTFTQFTLLGDLLTTRVGKVFSFDCPQFAIPLSEISTGGLDSYLPSLITHGAEIHSLFDEFFSYQMSNDLRQQGEALVSEYNTAVARITTRLAQVVPDTISKAKDNSKQINSLKSLLSAKVELLSALKNEVEVAPGLDGEYMKYMTSMNKSINEMIATKTVFLEAQGKLASAKSVGDELDRQIEQYKAALAAKNDATAAKAKPIASVPLIISQNLQDAIDDNIRLRKELAMAKIGKKTAREEVSDLRRQLSALEKHKREWRFTEDQMQKNEDSTIAELENLKAMINDNKLPDSPDTLIRLVDRILMCINQYNGAREDAIGIRT